MSGLPLVCASRLSHLFVPVGVPAVLSSRGDFIKLLARNQLKQLKPDA